MNHSATIDRGLSLRGRSVLIAIAATIVLALPVTAQDPSESPDAGTDTSGIAFPVMLGGQLLTPQTYSGDEWLAQYDDGEAANAAYVADTQSLLESVGATTDDMTVKSALYEPAPGEAAVVLALRIAGTDAREWVAGAVDVLVPDVVEPSLVMWPLDTKWALRVRSESMPGIYPRTIYLKDDTAWFIQGDDTYVGDALGQLPDADPLGPSSADSLLTDMPLTLGGERRLGISETTEPLYYMPTLADRLGDGLQSWLLDLYLEAGISPSQLLGVISWWGLYDGVQIEGYRLPEGGEEMTQRLLEDVFLIRPPEVSVDPDAPSAEPVDEIAQQLVGVGFEDTEIAGQAVTVLDYGGPKQYIYSSADTIWVISDPLGEIDKVEEAIAALP